MTTWENYDPAVAEFPIFKSTDAGKTWKEISRVKDTVNGWGLRYQPQLYELPAAFGGFPKGTILLAGNSIPADLSKTKIDIYASRDDGVTWEFVSSVASGGRAEPTNGLTPVWEPFLLLQNGELICYYSDQRDPAYGQKMVHQTSKDLKTWGPVVNDVTYPTYDFRPGMPTVAKLPNGNWIMTYEFFGATETPGQFAVYYKLAQDPTKFGDATGVVLRATDGFIPQGSPYVLWSPAGGANGTIVVDANNSADLFINTGNAELGTQWRRVSTNAPAAYTRSLANGLNNDVYIVAGGLLGQGATNKVTFNSQTL